VMKLSFFAPPELYSIVMKLSSFVMSSQDVKLSSWAAELSLVLAAAELALLVAAAELTAIVVAATQVVAIVVAATKVVAVVVAATKVDALVVAVNEFVAATVTSPNWKIQSLPRQTQCLACTIGRDNQRSYQVSIHHSLQVLHLPSMVLSFHSPFSPGYSSFLLWWSGFTLSTRTIAYPFGIG
jgi:hypothetical protein